MHDPVLEFKVNMQPELSEWQVILIDNSQGWSTKFRPAKGAEPNRFHRWMQELCFGVKWRKIK